MTATSLFNGQQKEIAAAIIDEASGHIKEIAGTPFGDVLQIRHFLADELGGIAVMLRNEPDHVGAVGIERAVCEDIARRQAAGIKKYGTTLGENKAELKARLQHAYEECLDQANYLKWAITMLESEEVSR